MIEMKEMDDRTVREVVVYDFDGTLTCGDSLPRFLRFAKGDGGYLAALVKTSPWLVLYKMGLYSNSKAKERLLGNCFRGWDAQDFANAARAFSLGEVQKMLRPDIYESLRRNVAAGHRVYIVSASLRQWIEPWAKSQGVTGVLATEMEVGDNGRFTGRFATPNCYGPEKARRLLEAEPDRSSYRLTVYGDSRGDRELMALSDTAHEV